MQSPTQLIPEKKARERAGGVSVMTFWRLRQKPESGFPQPVAIGKKNFYVESELEQWLASRPRKAGSAA